MIRSVNRERAIRSVVKQAVESYASGFSDRHLSEVDDAGGTINMKIHNVFIAALGSEIQYYSALARSLDSSLGNMLEKMAMNIASLQYDVCHYVEGDISDAQTSYIARLLESYKNTRGLNHRRPSISDYKGISQRKGKRRSKRHESDYYLYDSETGKHYLIELKIWGDLDNKKARLEKEALLEQYCILANQLGSEEHIHLYFATAYNRYGEERPWRQERVRQFFADDELLICREFWNFICKGDDGYQIVLDAYRQNAHYIVEALARIKQAYLP